MVSTSAGDVSTPVAHPIQAVAGYRRSHRIHMYTHRRISFFIFLALPAIPLHSDTVDPVALFRDGRFDRAKVAFTRVLNAEPENPVALYYLGRLTPEGAKSRGYFRRLLKSHPRHELADDAQFELAEADYAGPSGRYYRAANRYKRLLDEYGSSPLVPLTRYRLGCVYISTQRPDSALSVFQSIIDASPHAGIAPHARLGRIEALVLARRTREAKREADALVADSPPPAVAARLAVLRELLKGRDSAGRVWVRVGVFGSGDSLRRASGRLVRAGFPVVDEAAKVTGFRVLLVGPFPDRSAAEAQKPRVEKEAGVAHCVVVERD
ncbi:MAG: tetratricopeptide repeat protein [Gemmatimonadota bacterium]|nr:tetratricopeptide repeat protein [Gemmatimonadota bacterium]